MVAAIEWLKGFPVPTPLYVVRRIPG